MKMNWRMTYYYFTENNKNFLIFVAIFAGFVLLIIGGVNLDLLFNPWIVKAAGEWKWYNYFTSHHALTVLYIKNCYWPMAVISLILSSLTFLSIKLGN